MQQGTFRRLRGDRLSWLMRSRAGDQMDLRQWSAGGQAKAEPSCDCVVPDHGEDRLER